MRKRLSNVSRALGLSLLFAGLGFAATTATLMGRITNLQGSPVPGTRIDAVNVETHATITAETNHEGLYYIPGMMPGPYRIVVSKFGMKTIVKPSVELHVQDMVSINFAMQPGSVIQSVTVEEGAPLLDTDTAMQGIIVSQHTLNALPSLTRDPYDFAVLSAGAAPTNVAWGIGFAVNGQRAESSNFLLDGSDNNDSYYTGPGQEVPLDSVLEYRLQTNNFTAEYGRNAGYVANVVTKSGSNEFHVSAYDFLRNSSLAANTFQNNAAGVAKPDFNRNQFGGSAGGPIKSDSLFFFGAVEPVLVRSTSAVKFYVPTPQLLALSSPGTQAIFNRYSVPRNQSATDIVTRTVCPSGVACDPRSNSGFVTLPAFAAVTTTGPIDAGAGVPQNTYLYTGRIDYNLNSKTTIMGRYAGQSSSFYPTTDQPYSPYLDATSTEHNQNVTLAVTRTWTSTFMSDTRAVFNRVEYVYPDEAYGQKLAYSILSENTVLPSRTNGQGGPQNAYQVFHTQSWSHGRHNVKFGGEFLHMQDNRTPFESPATQRNQAQFRTLQDFVNGNLTSLQLSLNPQGQAPGDLVSPPFGPASTRRHYRFNDSALFIEDVWKITPRLTLSPGLRYEYFGVQHSTASEQNLDSNFYYGPANNIFQQIANGQLLETSNAPGAYKGHFYMPDPLDFAPRMGLAFDLTGDGKTVIRAGGGLFFDRFEGLGGISSNPPAYNLTRLQNVQLTPAIVSNPYLAFPNQPFPLTTSVVFQKDQNLKTARIYEWNASLEHAFHSAVVAATYIGSAGNRLYQLANDNRQGSGQFVGRPGTRLFEDASSFATVSNLGHSTYHALQLRADAPRIATLGLTFGANYTWSHSIDEASSLAGGDRVIGLSSYLLNPFNPALDKGSSDFDMRHRAVVHFMWDVPGPRASSGFLQNVLGNWQITGLAGFQTGEPLSLTDSGVPDRDLVDNTRPLLVGAAPQPLGSLLPDPLRPNTFLYLPLNVIRDSAGNCVAGAAPLACEPSVNGPYNGIIGRNTYTRPGTQFQNVALIKNFELSVLREGMRLQFRAEFYNPFNHSNLYVNVGTNNVAQRSFNGIPGVTASYGTPDRLPAEARQTVLALKLTF